MKAGLALLAMWLGMATSAHADPADFTQVERGRYLATVGDCVACHTVPGGTPFAGGRAIETPFGTLLSPNLTPDRATGIGTWSDADFVRAVRTGIDDNGAHLYPALPYPYFARATVPDVLAIRAYLATLDPASSPVDTNQLRFPFSIRATLIVWNALNFTPGVFKPDAGQSDEWNRGAYLVEGLGHCGACHTAKSATGGDKAGRILQGGVLNGWYAPPLDGSPRTGLGSWPVEQVVAYLKTGANDRQTAAGPMAEVVSLSTSHMTDADLHAIAIYLKARPAGGDPPVPALGAADARMQAGAALYTDNCSACHAPAGSGAAGLFPALRGSAAIQARDPATLVRVVLQGVQAGATDAAPTGAAMPAFGWRLTDAQVADVLTYTRNAWGNAAAAISTGTVREARTSLGQ